MALFCFQKSSNRRFPTNFIRSAVFSLGKQHRFPHVPPPKLRIDMVALRLTRKGSKDRPYYKIVAIDSRDRRDGRPIEQIGTYNPMEEGVNYTVDLEKVDKWIGNGAQPSETVNSIIRKARKAAKASA